MREEEGNNNEAEEVEEGWSKYEGVHTLPASYYY